MSNRFGLIARLGALVIGAALMGTACSSSSSQCGDGGCTGTTDGGGTLYGLSEGPYCYKIIGIASGASDGCALDVASLVNKDLPGTYTSSTGTLSLGTEGSLGAGQISRNVGTLTRSGMVTDSTMTSCSWTQMDTTTVTLTADNTFTASVTETESGFAAACSGTPASGTCTSTWTWTMMIDSSKSASNGCQ